ncbi:uncharacterized protein B0H64DRAFT_397566 [Chaetomium fimeti]|uniref:Putative gamma-glutamylcyclotransferase n=1 Tax=Chaetomium fimeti TaxID=1854472 RepID=A0AAE0HGJ6_9PEZI|nr:hypothetical protein B0H64DRAFT_397566 [Chaetomium fimeti]
MTDSNKLSENPTHDASTHLDGKFPSSQTSGKDDTLTAPLGPEAGRDDNDGKQNDFEPCTFFFYGSLMDPQVLMAVAKLDDQPDLQDVWVEGFEMKMWGGIYPVLLPINDTDNNSGASHRIKGKAWRATTMDQCLRLQRYETSAYEPADCRLYHPGGGEPTKGLVFVWARDPGSNQLAEGVFDLEDWQKTHKPSRFPV